MTTLMRDTFRLTDVKVWVEVFDEATRDEDARKRTFANFVLLDEPERWAREVLDRIHRRDGRGFLVTGLYGSGKTLFMAYLSALLTDPGLRKQLLDLRPEWGLDELARRKILTINFTAIANQDRTLEESLWQAARRALAALSPPRHVSLSNTDVFLDAVKKLGAGTRNDLDDYLKQHRKTSLAQLAGTDSVYQKQVLEQALHAVGVEVRDTQTTVKEKVQLLLDAAREQGYEGVAVFSDELYLHLIESNETFNRGTAFLSQLAEAGLVGSRPFWVFGAVQEELQAIARQAGRNYDVELMGRLVGEAGRFRNLNLPVTQFHRIYNHRLFEPNSKWVNKLRDLYHEQLRPRYRGSFEHFFKRYFAGRPLEDEGQHFADLYPMHPYALHCLTKLTNRGGRSRGALGFVADFCRRAVEDGREWSCIAVLDDLFGYSDLRNKIIQNDPDVARYYELFDRFSSQALDQVLNGAPYKAWPEQEKQFAPDGGQAADQGTHHPGDDQGRGAPVAAGRCADAALDRQGKRPGGNGRGGEAPARQDHAVLPGLARQG
jgi:hypothetical protein